MVIKLARSIVIIGVVLLTFGCRIKSPTLQEQQALAQRGAFGVSTPAWVARQARASSTLGRAASGGFLSISAPESKVRPNITDQEDRLAIAKKRPAKDVLSPLEKLTNDCKGLEAQITDALTTTDVIERVAKYEYLVSKCSSAEQLLIWLAEDYLTLRDFSAARRTINQILVLNSQSKEAQALLKSYLVTNKIIILRGLS